MGKPMFPEDERIFIKDTIYCLNNLRQIKQCYAYLTSRRLIAMEKPSSFFQSIKSTFSDSSKVSFEISLNDLSSMRKGQLGLIDLVILKTADKVEYALQFPQPEETWMQAILDAVKSGQPDIEVKTIGDYTKFKRQ